MGERHSSASADDPRGGFYYDTATGQVTHGQHRSWRHRMGPYETREEAEDALRTARARTREWDEDEDED